MAKILNKAHKTPISLLRAGTLPAAVGEKKGLGFDSEGTIVEIPASMLFDGDDFIFIIKNGDNVISLKGNFTPLPDGDILLNAGFITSDATDVTVDGSQVNKSFIVRLNNIKVSNNTLEVFAITAASAGQFRKDRISLNSLGEYVITTGTPGADETVILLPNSPVNSITIGAIDINDTGISNVYTYINDAFIAYSYNQVLSPAQMLQARANISAVSSNTAQNITSRDWRFRDLANLTNLHIAQGGTGAGASVAVFMTDPTGLRRVTISNGTPSTELGSNSANFYLRTIGTNTRTIVTWDDGNDNPIFSMIASGESRFYNHAPLHTRSATFENSIRRDETRLYYLNSIGTAGVINDQALVAGIFNYRFNNATEITGFGNGEIGRVVTIQNDNTVSLTIKHEDAASIAANRAFVIGAADLVIPTRGKADFIYCTGNRWELKSKNF